MNQKKNGPNGQQFDYIKSAWPLWTNRPIHFIQIWWLRAGNAKHHCIKLIKPFGILELLYLGRNKRLLWTLRVRHLPQKLKFWKENLAVLLFHSSILLIENYSQNQCHYLKNQCLKYDLIKTRRNCQKQKQKAFFSCTESSIFNTNPNNIKLQML